MEKVASGTFKKDFGKVLQEAYRNPVTITRHGRDFVTIIPSQDFVAIQNEILGEYFLEKVNNGELSLLEAIKAEKQILDDVALAEQDDKQGIGVEYSSNYVADIKQKFMDTQQITS